MAYRGNVLSINTSRDLPQGVQAVRASDPPFNPTAAPFVNHAGVEHTSAIPGVGFHPTPAGFDLSGYAPNPFNHRHTLATQEQNTPDHMQGHMRHWPNRHSISAAIRLPPPSMGVTRALTPPRSRSNTIQYTPNSRPYHKAIAPSPVAESHMANPQPPQPAVLCNRLDKIQELKKGNLVAFTRLSAEISNIRNDLEHSWDDLNANDGLAELYERENQAQESERLRDFYGRSFETANEEIEQLWADIVVPHDARAQAEGVYDWGVSS